MKKIKILSVIAVCLMISIFAGCTIVDNTTIATVNGEKISKNEFAIYFAQIQYSMLDQAGIQYGEDVAPFWETTEIEGKNAFEFAKESALQEAVKIKLKNIKAKELGVSLADQEMAAIDERIGMQISEIGGKEEYESQLKEIGTTISAYEDWFRSVQLSYKVDSTLASMEENAVSDEEARESIKNTYIKAKHILISTIDDETQMPLSDEEVAAAKTKAEGILNEIRNGADFDKLMRENSQDPGLETSPGGYEFGKGQMVAEFENAAYALEVGQVSDIVKSSYGYHIIKREPFTATEATYEENVATEKEVIRARKINAIVEKWQSEADVEVNEKALAKLEPID